MSREPRDGVLARLGDRPGLEPFRTQAGGAFVAVALVAAVLTLVSLVLPRITPWDFLRDPTAPVVEFIDLRAETNLPTWFTVVVLTLAAAVLALLAVLSRRTGSSAWPWAVLAGAVALLSIDELAALHEELEPLGRDIGGGEGLLHFAWLIPGFFLAAAFLATIVAAARQLPRQVVRWLAAGTVTLLVAAIGLEALGGAVLSSRGDGAVYILMSHLEEFLEMCAAGCFLAAGVSALRVRSGSAAETIELSAPVIERQRARADPA